MKIPQRGFVLISILVLTLLATFFIGALIQMNPSRLRRAVHDERHDLAAAAAKAGVDFALAKLAQEPDWRGQGQGFLVKSEQLVVREDRGNVWGWIRAKEGEWSGFCFRFNYQDGAVGADELPQPGQIMPFEGISVNNLKGPSSVPLPLGDGPDYSFAGRFGYGVPEYSVALLVQGMVGPEVAPDKYPATKSNIVTRQVEGLYKASGLAGLADGSVLQAGADSDFILGNQEGDQRGHLRLMADGQIARMRTKGRSTIQQGTGKRADYNFYPDLDAEIRVGRGFAASAKTGQTYWEQEEEPNDPMLDIEWSKVSQSSQPDRLRLPAGVYAVFDEKSSQRVRYYDMTVQQYRNAYISGSSPTPSDLPPDFPGLKSSKNGRNVIEFDRDVEVVPTNDNNKGIAIIPAKGAKQQALPPEVYAIDLEQQAGTPQLIQDLNLDPFEIPESILLSDSTVPQDLEIHFAPASGKSAAIRAEGNVLLGTHLSGKGGAVVSGGRVDLLGLGIDIEANQGGERDGISLYAQGPINISTYDRERQKYWDVSIKGVLFSREGITVRLGEQSENVSPGWGFFDFQGAAVSLGDASAVIGGGSPIEAPQDNNNSKVNGGQETTQTDDGGEVPDSGSGIPTSTPGVSGYVRMIADGIRMTYEPKFLAPYVKGEQLVLTFQSISVVER